jgi:hypothetical protein
MTTSQDIVERLAKALSDALDYVDRNTCEHEDTFRGGFLWTICRGCGRKWADDEGGFVPHTDPEPIAAARAALTAYRASLQNDGWNEWKGGECPVRTPVVEVRFRDGDTDTRTPDEFSWRHLYGAYDIIAWRLAK